MAMEPMLVVYPVPAMGHLVPIVELAKLAHHNNFAVSVVLMHSPKKHPSVDPFVTRVSSAYPSISFHQLPPPAAACESSGSTFVDSVRENNAELHHFLAAHRRTSDIRAVILDFFCTDALSVVAELGLRSYFFFASGSADLAALLYLPFLHATTEQSFADLGETPIHFPGLPPVPASHMPRHVMRREDESYKKLVNIFDRIPDGDGILINSFESLEADAVAALRAGVSVPGRRMPPIYCIGPLIAGGEGDTGGKDEKTDSITWLDEQPRGSVVFLCFGSMGTFSPEQLKQIAAGLERSGQRFLWVVRAPRDQKVKEPQGFTPLTEPDLEALLPEGFLERTKQRGLVVKSWAPQVEVLNHEAVGGFVTHCGWNSALEAISAGVAMVAWPLYAEQWMNKVFLVEQMRLAEVMEGYDKEMVTAEEVERKIRWLMEAEGGRELRERAAATKESAARARRQGGSSQLAWREAMSAFQEGNH